MVNFNVYYATNWATNNYNAHTGQYLKKEVKATRQ